MIVEVALNLPLRRSFDYRWPNNLARVPETGLQVLVPFGAQKKGGVVVRVKEKSDFNRLKSVESLVDEEPLFSSEMLKLTKWTSEYYFCAWGETLNSAIPGGLTLRLSTSLEIVQNLTRTIEIGETYTGPVKKVLDFGAFVEVFPGTEGLVHISNLAEGRVEKVTDVCKEGDIVTVKATGVDRRGKIQLSIKEV